MYGIGGERQLEEQVLDHLDGYEGARPVRIGNGAYDAAASTTSGARSSTRSTCTRSRATGCPSRFWPILCKQVEKAIAHWREPDRGIWEVRGEPKHFTSSKVMCWVACDRGARLARLREDAEQAERWQAAADEIHADVCEQRRRRARRLRASTTSTDALDASLPAAAARALPAARRPAHPSRPSTAIADELTVDGLVLRYQVEETDDGLAGEEGTFAICSFWLVSALAEIGETPRARELCERMLELRVPAAALRRGDRPALRAATSGNFPQAFTHLALINAVMHVIRADHELAASKAPLTVLEDPTAAEEAS